MHRKSVAFEWRNTAHASFLSERLHGPTAGAASSSFPLRPALSTRPLSMPLSRRTVARRETSSTLVRRPNSWVSALPSLLPSRDAPTPHIESIMSVEPEPRRRAGAQRPTPKRRRANQTSGHPQRPSESDFDVTSFQTVRTPRLESRVEGLGARFHSSARFHSFPKKSSV